MVSSKPRRASMPARRVLVSWVCLVSGALALSCVGGSGRQDEPELSRDGLAPESIEALDVVADLQAAMLGMAGSTYQ